MNVNIRDLLNNIEDSSVDLEEKNVVSSERIKELTKMKLNNDTTKKIVRSSKKKIVTVSIVAAVIGALGLSAYAAFRGLDNASFGKSSWIPEGVDVPPEATATIISDDLSKTTTKASEISAESSKTSSEFETSSTSYETYVVPPREDISLQGFADSPEYKAAQEWHEFEKSYDRDFKIIDAYDKEVKKTGKNKFEKKYGAYLVYSQEMADKMDEIVKKYKLKLHDPFLGDADEKKYNELYGDFIKPGVTAGGYYHKDGTLGFDGVYNDCKHFQFTRTVKGYFDTTFLNIGAKSGYDQWTYKTKDGYTAYISLGNCEAYKGKAVVLIDLENSFVSFNVLPWKDYDATPTTHTPAEIEELIDQFDYAKLDNSIK